MLLSGCRMQTWKKTCQVTHRHCLSSPQLLSSSTGSYHPQKWLSKEKTNKYTNQQKQNPKPNNPSQPRIIFKNKNTHTKPPKAPPKENQQKATPLPKPTTKPNKKTKKHPSQKNLQTNPTQSKIEYFNCLIAKASTLTEAATESSLS